MSALDDKYLPLIEEMNKSGFVRNTEKIIKVGKKFHIFMFFKAVLIVFNYPLGVY